jgi:hypothetical protein
MGYTSLFILTPTENLRAATYKFLLALCASMPAQDAREEKPRMFAPLLYTECSKKEGEDD